MSNLQVSSLDRGTQSEHVWGNSGERSKPRICMPTFRRFTKRAFRCGLYEAQDVLTSIDNVDLVPLEMGWGSGFKESWLRRPLYHDVTRRLMFVNPGLKKIQLTQDYDLFLAVCHTYSDLPYINAIHNWKDHCKISVCWIDEMWAASISGYSYWLEALSRFDYVFVGCRGSVACLESASGQPCHWLPGAVDTLRFGPYPNPAPRVIDVYSMGRRREPIHQALLDASAQGSIFYIHDTFAANDSEVYNHQQHRILFANMAKRSRFFVVAPGKMDDAETQGQVEVGYRYYEGAAAGTVMIGQAPDCEAYRQLFRWPNAVVDLRSDGSDVLDVLSSLNSDPQLLSDMSRRNSAEALLRHDWAYRWKELFRIAGLEPSSKMAARENELRALAAMALQSSVGSPA